MDKLFLTLSECQNEAAEIACNLKAVLSGRAVPVLSPIRIYGVPQGGIPVAYMVKEALLVNEGMQSEVVYKAEIADVIVDDIIDSGATKARFPKDKPFFALVDKKFDGDEWFVFPWEVCAEADTSAHDIVLRFLQYIGEDPKRKGIVETPSRVVKSWSDLYKGYKIDEKEIFKTFDEPCDEMVILRNIEFYSMCEHHCLPFFGKVHIAYIPNGKVVGISKLARLVECYSRRLQIQERMTQQITEAIVKHLSPLGVACFVEAKHLCMMARGVEKQNSVMVTSSLRGVFKEKDAPRMEFLLLNGRGDV
jgi:GTP cyclohydrolase I